MNHDPAEEEETSVMFLLKGALRNESHPLL